MKKETVLLFVLIAVAVLGGGYFFSAPEDQSPGVSLSDTDGTETGADAIDWKEYSDGLAQAQSQGKHIFLYFYADW